MKHRAVIVGAGRIGAGYNWQDDAYTHAGAYRALKDRVELVGFVEPDMERTIKARQKWGVPVFPLLDEALEKKTPDIVSVCVQPEQQREVMRAVYPLMKAVWCEKPWMGLPILASCAIQVNYLRRADKFHQWMAREHSGGLLKVFGKDDIHTVCHFNDLAAWWKAGLQYHPQEGPCHYYYQHGEDTYAFPNGGLEKPGDQMRDMLGNLLDHLDKGVPLWSPPQIV